MGDGNAGTGNAAAQQPATDTGNGATGTGNGANGAPNEGELGVREFMICNDTTTQAFAQTNGYTCTQQCPAGYDPLTANFGTTCTPHYGQQEISQWPTCQASTDCSSQTRCGLSPQATDGTPMTGADATTRRCMPNNYVIYLAYVNKLTLY